MERTEKSIVQYELSIVKDYTVPDRGTVTESLEI